VYKYLRPPASYGRNSQAEALVVKGQTHQPGLVCIRSLLQPPPPLPPGLIVTQHIATCVPVQWNGTSEGVCLLMRVGSNRRLGGLGLSPMARSSALVVVVGTSGCSVLGIGVGLVVVETVQSDLVGRYGDIGAVDKCGGLKAPQNQKQCEVSHRCETHGGCFGWRGCTGEKIVPRGVQISTHSVPVIPIYCSHGACKQANTVRSGASRNV
jgi:hypothetical protein